MKIYAYANRTFGVVVHDEGDEPFFSLSPERAIDLAVQLIDAAQYAKREWPRRGAWRDIRLVGE